MVFAKVLKIKAYIGSGFSAYSPAANCESISIPESNPEKNV